jgi:diguanylate cyclase (GGDEF)-like protein/PAS domain S-box-containing protein
VNRPDQSGKVFSLGKKLSLAALTSLLVLALTWLYFRAESVAPETHFNYTQQLRDLRELDARVDGQLLANRLELVRNYDALTHYMQQAVKTAQMAVAVPDFLSPADRLLVSDAAKNLLRVLAIKADNVDRFKRDNSVLRNSMAFFPVVTATFLRHKEHTAQSHRTYDTVSTYTRGLFAFALSPSSDSLALSHQARSNMAAVAHDPKHLAMIDNILLHGDVITTRLSALDKLMQEIANLHSEELLETLNSRYAEGHSRAQASASHFRTALFALAITLTAFLAWLFIRLDVTRRSLAQTHQELVARYNAQLATEKQLVLHATAFRSAHDGITLTDAAGKILDVNPAFSRITGWERSEVIGRNPRVLKSGRHDSDFYKAMWKSINETDNWRGEIWNRNKYGEVYPELLSISAVRDESGSLTNYVAVFSDIGRLKAQESQLSQMAYYDALTELPNRVLLADRLTQGIAQSRRTGLLMTICYLDLDGFKPINDTWGHDAGDLVLIEMAKRMRGILRGGDTVARLGGDEFVLLLLGSADTTECEVGVKRLLKQIAQPLNILPKEVVLSASVGVTIFPLDNQDSDTLLRHADQAMYRAKQEGKNRYQIFDAEQDRFARTRHNHVSRIYEAFDKDELTLHYQPKVNMRQGKVIGAEALIRWEHPQRGLLPPIEFLPLIEDDELIVLIGDWVIETALRQMETWKLAGLSLPLSVNLAGRQLQAADFVEKLKTALARHPTVARQLELEILETAALEDVVKTSRVIEECRVLGVKFSLDDFGTGYSSLTYLKRLPAETIKIDQSFVREILSDFNNLVIVQGVISLASAFQRQIVAEGVETVEHGRLLMQLNCDQAQGYGIAKPMPPAAIPAWIQHWHPDAAWQAISNLYWEDADYPMLIAEIQLRNWVTQIVYAANEGLAAQCQRLDDPEYCAFGRWYNGTQRSRYAPYKAFKEIDIHHQRLHAIASAMDNHWRDSRLDLLRAMTPEFLATRDKLLAALHELQNCVGIRHASLIS